ncbi:MAG: AzlC family ABC transporter permease [Ardenticatenaceae bacterium]|nr:AzlC family ABC transporter permease [Ardenticatenaceae bacterium]
MTQQNDTTTPKSEFWAGVKAELPILFGVIPFGLIFGVLATTAGLPPLVAWSTSSLVFAGSAQFLALPLFSAGAPAVILIMTTFIINLRHLLYSASLAPFAQPLSRGWKTLLAYLLTDEAFVPTILHYHQSDQPSTHKHWFWLGAGLTLWLNWQIVTGIGILVGQQLPSGLGLEFTLSLTFIGMIVPTLKKWPEIGAAVSAGVTAVAVSGLPYRLNLMVAAVVGIFTGLLLESLTRRESIGQTQEVQL